MRATGSTRMATPWRWCSAVAMVAAACVTTTTRYFMASEGETRLNQHTIREEGDALLALECERLLGADRPMGEAQLRLQVTQSGNVTRAELTRSSGDARIDGIFGALASRLRFDPLPAEATGGTTTPLHMGYSCAPGIAVTTVRVGRGGATAPPRVARSRSRRTPAPPAPAFSSLLTGRWRRRHSCR